MTHARRKDVDTAVHMLMQGYEEEMRLYSVVHDLALEQKALLVRNERNGAFSSLLKRKEHLLDIIGRLESEMSPAKSLVMAQQPGRCPHRWRLAALLDSLQDMIEEIRDAERENISFLESIPA